MHVGTFDGVPQVPQIVFIFLHPFYSSDWIISLALSLSLLISPPFACFKSAIELLFYLYLFSRSAIIKHHRLGDLNNRIFFFPHKSLGWKSEIMMLEDLLSPENFSLACRLPVLHCVFTLHTPRTAMCPNFISYKNTSQIRLRPSLTAPF